MEKLKTIIEKGKDGYGIYIPNTSINSFGETIEEAKQNLNSCIIEYVDLCKEENIPYEEIFDNEYKLIYKFDLSEIFNTYSVINVSKLAERINMNASLLRQYKNGITQASENQKKIIEQGLHNLGNELLSIQL